MESFTEKADTFKTIIQRKTLDVAVSEINQNWLVKSKVTPPVAIRSNERRKFRQNKKPYIK